MTITRTVKIAGEEYSINFLRRARANQGCLAMNEMVQLFNPRNTVFFRSARIMKDLVSAHTALVVLSCLQEHLLAALMLLDAVQSPSPAQLRDRENHRLFQRITEEGIRITEGVLAETSESPAIGIPPRATRLMTQLLNFLPLGGIISLPSEQDLLTAYAQGIIQPTEGLGELTGDTSGPWQTYLQYASRSGKMSDDRVTTEREARIFPDSVLEINSKPIAFRWKQTLLALPGGEVQ